MIHLHTNRRSLLRTAILFAFLPISAFSQPFTFGAKLGIPAEQFLNTVQTGNIGFASYTNRYLVGPTAELRLPFGLGLEVDALYRHYSFFSPGFRTPPPVIQLIDGYESVHSGDWEFPLLAKYRFGRRKFIRPYVEAGPAWDVLQRLDATVCSINCGNTSVTPSLRRNAVTGFVSGAGVRLGAGFLSVSPEIRYTRWGSEHFVSSTGNLASNRNQLEVLLGVTF